jgi:hypothetical protein
MTITKLIEASLKATSLYESARNEYELDYCGEFDHCVRGLRLRDDMLKADAAIESHALSIF